MLLSTSFKAAKKASFYVCKPFIDKLFDHEESDAKEKESEPPEAEASV